MEMTSYETLALFYETSNTLDRFFDFWLSATFAVVVAAHLGRDSINRSYARVIVVLYLSFCLLYTSPSPRDGLLSRMPSSA